MNATQVRADLAAHLSYSRIQKYLTCPEQYRLYYIEGLRPKREAAARVFGAVVHQALAEFFRREADPVHLFREEWQGCREFDLRYSRESWTKLADIGERLLTMFVRDEAPKLGQILAVETPFEMTLSNLPRRFVGVLDLVAIMNGKKTLVDFKTASADYAAHDVALSDQLTAYCVAMPDIEQAALCVLVKKRQPEIVWHFTERTTEQQFEYVEKTEAVAAQIARGIFYKRVGFWCRQCEFVPVCMKDENRTHETLVRIT